VGPWQRPLRKTRRAGSREFGQTCRARPTRDAVDLFNRPVRGRFQPRGAAGGLRPRRRWCQYRLFQSFWPLCSWLSLSATRTRRDRARHRRKPLHVGPCRTLEEILFVWLSTLPWLVDLWRERSPGVPEPAPNHEPVL